MILPELSELKRNKTLDHPVLLVSYYLVPPEEALIEGLELQYHPMGPSGIVFEASVHGINVICAHEADSLLASTREIAGLEHVLVHLPAVPVPHLDVVIGPEGPKNSERARA